MTLSSTRTVGERAGTPSAVPAEQTAWSLRLADPVSGTAIGTMERAA